MEPKNTKFRNNANFIIMDMWVNHPSFNQTIQQIWRQILAYWIVEFKKMREESKIWNKMTFGKELAP